MMGLLTYLVHVLFIRYLERFCSIKAIEHSYYIYSLSSCNIVNIATGCFHKISKRVFSLMMSNSWPLTSAAKKGNRRLHPVAILDPVGCSTLSLMNTDSPFWRLYNPSSALAQSIQNLNSKMERISTIRMKQKTFPKTMVKRFLASYKRIRIDATSYWWKWESVRITFTIFWRRTRVGSTRSLTYGGFGQTTNLVNLYVFWAMSLCESILCHIFLEAESRIISPI